MTSLTIRPRGCSLVMALAFVLAPGYFTPVSVAAQDVNDTTRVTIEGLVVDAATRRPIRGVTVTLHAFDLEIETDINGLFEVRGLRVGVYAMTLRMFDYQTVSGDFEVLDGGTFTIAMEPLTREGPPALGRFIGRVTDADEGSMMQGVGVRIPELFMGVLTDEAGRFVLEDVPAGVHLVEFDHLGYATRRETVTVVADQTTDARVGLTVDAIDLEPIEVVVERRELNLERVGFYDRRDEGWGEFVDLEDIEARAPAVTTDLFQRMPGVTLEPDAYDPFLRYVLLRGGRTNSLSGRPCYPAVWLDGIQVHRGGDRPAVLNDLVNTNAIAGIEVYATNSGIPVRYGGMDAACGVVLMWTRI